MSILFIGNKYVTYAVGSKLIVFSSYSLISGYLIRMNLYVITIDFEVINQKLHKLNLSTSTKKRKSKLH